MGAGLMPGSPWGLRIGDRVTLDGHRDPPWDGTVVDIIEPGGIPPSVRVYWRYPLGRVSDHRGGLRRYIA
jgi:hypothetical protein